MTRGDAISLFNYERERCGLSPDWKVRISVKMRMTFGRCFFVTETIKLNALYIQEASVEDITDTIRHEIAHALVGPGHGHDRVWRRKAIELGCSGKRCGTAKTHGRHIGHCDKCAHEFTRSKSPVSTLYLGDCDKCGVECRRNRRPRRGVLYTHIANGCGGKLVFTRTRKEAATYSHRHCGGTIVFADRGVQYEGPRELVRK